MKVGIVGFCLLFGCAGPDENGPLASGPMGQDPSAFAGSTGEAPDTDAWPRAQGSDDDDGDGGGFITFADTPELEPECDLYAQDCPAGQKCNPYSNDGGPSWNATRCVPVVDGSVAKGEPCRRLDGINNGVDDCGYGSVCWDVDEEGIGMCVPLCLGSEEAPYCDAPGETCAGGKSVQVCLPTCDPLGLDGNDPCPAGCACYPWSSTFICAPDASGDLGRQGHPCEFINSCSPGHACVGAELVPDCAGNPGCCAAYCDATQPSSCAAYAGGIVCELWYPEGLAPPGFEQVGACVLPM